MQNITLKRATIIFLPLIVLLCLGLWANQKVVPAYLINSDDAVYDMRGLDFSKGYATTNRVVEYVPGVLLNPQEFDARNDIQTGNVPQGTFVVTARMRYLVSDDITYAIYGFSMNQASTVYVNGKLLFSEGKPAYSLKEEVGNEATHLFTASAENGVIEIVIASSSFSHIETSPGMSWHFGDYQTMRSFYVHYSSSYIIMMAWYVLAGLIFLLLYLALPKYRASGLLVILSLVFALRTGLTGSKPLLTLMPVLDWATGFRLELISVPVAVILLVFVFSTVFPGSFPKWLKLTLVSISALLAVLELCLSTYVLSEYYILVQVLLYIIIVVMILSILLSLRTNKPDLPRVIMLAGIAAIVLSTVWDLSYYLGNAFNLPFSIAQPMIMVFLLFALTSTALTTVVSVAQAKSETTRLRIEMLEQEAAIAQTSAAVMLSQIQPHFLYNVLTSISSLCEDNDRAQNAIITFSKYLRMNMDSLTHNGLIPFTQEIEHVRQYLWLEQLRFEARLTVEYDLNTENFMLPVLSVQPIVENAVRYGITKKRNGGTVTIRTQETDEAFFVVISDDGAGFNPSAKLDSNRSHTGIENVRSRLAAMCAGSLEIESSPGHGTSAVLKIPKNSSQQKHSS